MSVVTVEVQFAEMTGDHHYSKRAHSPCKFSILKLIFGCFYKNKACFQKHRKRNLVFSSVVLHVQCNVCLCDKYSAVY